MTTPRAHCLDTAKALVTGDRQDTYGDLRSNAQTWCDLMQHARQSNAGKPRRGQGPPVTPG